MLCLAAHWSASFPTERELLSRDGFYGRLNAYVTNTGLMPRRRNKVRVSGIEYECFAYDAFQRPSK